MRLGLCSSLPFRCHHHSRHRGHTLPWLQDWPWHSKAYERRATGTRVICTLPQCIAVDLLRTKLFAQRRAVCSVPESSTTVQILADQGRLTSADCSYGRVPCTELCASVCNAPFSSRFGREATLLRSQFFPFAAAATLILPVFSIKALASTI